MRSDARPAMLETLGHLNARGAATADVVKRGGDMSLQGSLSSRANAYSLIQAIPKIQLMGRRRLFR